MPDVRGALELDANVFQDDCETADNPCPEDERRTPACEITGPRRDALRVCDFFDRPLAISFWFTGGADCLAEQDAFDARAPALSATEVNFLSINVRDDLRRGARRSSPSAAGSVPVGWDRDGAVSNVYRVGVCPTVALAYPGGILHAAEIGDRRVHRGRAGRGARRAWSPSPRRGARRVD